MLTSLDIPATISESWMNPKSTERLYGQIIFLEVWTHIPTFAFMTASGEVYHDLPLQAFDIKTYYGIKPIEEWTTSGPQCWHIENIDTVEAREQLLHQRPLVFNPPTVFGTLFKDRNTILAKTCKIHKGLVWPESNILLYLCEDRRGSKLYLWPVHKIRFLVSSIELETPLPNWTKNRHE